jgi:hypothetical protein
MPTTLADNLAKIREGHKAICSGCKHWTPARQIRQVNCAYHLQRAGHRWACNVYAPDLIQTPLF